jgi:hypothetical protein
MAIYFLGQQQQTTQPGTSESPTINAPITLSNSASVKVNASATSIQLMAARAGRKSLYMYNDSNKACFISINGTAATANTATTPNFKYWIPSQYGMQIDVNIPTGALNVIFEASATGSIIATEGF